MSRLRIDTSIPSISALEKERLRGSIEFPTPVPKSRILFRGNELSTIDATILAFWIAKYAGSSPENRTLSRCKRWYSSANASNSDSSMQRLLRVAMRRCDSCATDDIRGPVLRPGLIYFFDDIERPSFNFHIKPAEILSEYPYDRQLHAAQD